MKKASKKSNRAGSLEEVMLFATTYGATEKAARWFWFKCEGNGWENGGRPILNWKATFAAWWEAEHFPRNTYSTHSGRQTLEDMKDEILGRKPV